MAEICHYSKILPKTCLYIVCIFRVHQFRRWEQKFKFCTAAKNTVHMYRPTPVIRYFCSINCYWTIFFEFSNFLPLNNYNSETEPLIMAWVALTFLSLSTKHFDWSNILIKLINLHVTRDRGFSLYRRREVLWCFRAWDRDAKLKQSGSSYGTVLSSGCWLICHNIGGAIRFAFQWYIYFIIGVLRNVIEKCWIGAVGFLLARTMKNAMVLGRPRLISKDVALLAMHYFRIYVNLFYSWVYHRSDKQILHV